MAGVHHALAGVHLALAGVHHAVAGAKTEGRANRRVRIPGQIPPEQGARRLMLTGVSLTCFAGGYLIALVLEGSRLVSPAKPRRFLLIMVMTVAGLAAHTLYLYNLARSQWDSGGGLLTGWYEWCLLGAWLLAAAYLGMAVRRPENNLGVFLLPLVLFLIVTAVTFQKLAPQPFSRSEAVGAWRVIHGAAQLLGTAGVLLGFSAGVMYLLQAYRLKKALPPTPGLRLPSLEWLRRMNHEMLFVSLVCCTAGLLSGVVLNANQQGVVAWTDPVVLSSSVLVGWLIAAVIFERAYRPARQGHKVAYLTLASVVFLVLALVLVLVNKHGAADPGTEPSKPAVGSTIRAERWQALACRLREWRT